MTLYPPSFDQIRKKRIEQMEFRQTLVGEISIRCHWVSGTIDGKMAQDEPG